MTATKTELPAVPTTGEEHDLAEQFVDVLCRLSDLEQCLDGWIERHRSDPDRLFSTVRAMNEAAGNAREIVYAVADSHGLLDL